MNFDNLCNKDNIEWDSRWLIEEGVMTVCGLEVRNKG